MRALCDGVNNLGVMVYSAEKSDQKVLQKVKSSLNDLENHLPIVL